MNNFIKILSNNEKHAVDEEIQSVAKYLDDKSIYNGIMLQNLCRDEQSTIVKLTHRGEGFFISYKNDKYWSITRNPFNNKMMKKGFFAIKELHESILSEELIMGIYNFQFFFPVKCLSDIETTNKNGITISTVNWTMLNNAKMFGRIELRPDSNMNNFYIWNE